MLPMKATPNFSDMLRITWEGLRCLFLWNFIFFSLSSSIGIPLLANALIKNITALATELKVGRMALFPSFGTLSDSDPVLTVSDSRTNYTTRSMSLQHFNSVANSNKFPWYRIVIITCVPIGITAAVLFCYYHNRENPSLKKEKVDNKTNTDCSTSKKESKEDDKNKIISEHISRVLTDKLYVHHEIEGSASSSHASLHTNINPVSSGLYNSSWNNNTNPAIFSNNDAWTVPASCASPICSASATAAPHSSAAPLFLGTAALPTACFPPPFNPQYNAALDYHDENLLAYIRNDGFYNTTNFPNNNYTTKNAHDNNTNAIHQTNHSNVILLNDIHKISSSCPHQPCCSNYSSSASPFNSV